MSEKKPQGFEPLLAGIGRSRAWRFFARNRLLCLLIAIGILCILDQRHAETKIVAVIALIGSVFCLKKFALDHCIWIYLLAILIYPCIAMVAYETALHVQTDWQRTAFPLHAIYLVCSSVLGLLAAIPCSLLFVKKFNKISELWKVPVCVFFLFPRLILSICSFFTAWERCSSQSAELRRQEGQALYRRCSFLSRFPRKFAWRSQERTFAPSNLKKLRFFTRRQEHLFFLMEHFKSKRV